MRSRHPSCLCLEATWDIRVICSLLVYSAPAVSPVQGPGLREARCPHCLLLKVPVKTPEPDEDPMPALFTVGHFTDRSLSPSFALYNRQQRVSGLCLNPRWEKPQDVH